MHEKLHIPWRYTFDSPEDIIEPLNKIIEDYSNPNILMELEKPLRIRKSSVQSIPQPRELIYAEMARNLINKGKYATAEMIIKRIN